MPIFVEIAIKIIIMIILMSLQKTKAPPSGNIDDINITQASESDPIGVGYGTAKIAGNCVWYGDFDTKPIKVSGGFFSPDVTIGYKYFLGIHVAIGHGESVLQKIKMNEKDVWINTGDTGNFRGTYDAPHLISEDNGVAANFQWWSGTNNLQDPYVNGFAKTPPHKGLAHIVFEKAYIGNQLTPPSTQYISSFYKNYAFFDQDKIIIDDMTDTSTVTLGEKLNITTPLNSSKSFTVKSEDGLITYNNTNYDLVGDDIIIKINQDSATNPMVSGQKVVVEYYTRYYDLNPAVIIYDALVSKRYGISESPLNIDEQSFVDAQRVLYTEGFGLSLFTSNSVNGDDFINEIKRHIAAEIVDDYSTGKQKLKLIRNDYDINNLTTLDENNITEIQNYARTARDDLYSSFNCQFTNKRKDFNSSLAPYKDVALRLERSTNTQSVTQQFNFCTKLENALKIAYREGTAASNALATFNLTCFKIEGLEKGDVVKLNWEANEISNMVLRIQEVDYGRPGDNKMTIKAVQDVFGIQFSSFTDLPEKGFVPIDFAAKNMALNIIDCNKFLSQDNVNRILTFGSKPTSAAYKYNLLIDEVKAGSASSFTLDADIKEAISFQDSTIKITTSNFADITEFSSEQILQGANLCLITDGVDQEFISFESKNIVGADQLLLNVKRGCCDTKPKEWGVNAKIYFISQGNAISNNVTLTESQSITVKALTVTPIDVLKAEDATGFIYNMSAEQRNLKPIVAANMKVNNTLVFDYITIGTNDLMNLTWDYRNVENQTVVKSYFDAAETSNNGNEYRIIVKDSLGVVLDDVTTTNNTYEYSESLPYESELNVEVITLLNGKESFDKHVFQVVRV